MDVWLPLFLFSVNLICIIFISRLFAQLRQGRRFARRAAIIWHQLIVLCLTAGVFIAYRWTGIKGREQILLSSLMFGVIYTFFCWVIGLAQMIRFIFTLPISHRTEESGQSNDVRDYNLDWQSVERPPER